MFCDELYGGHICSEETGHDLPHRCECGANWTDPDD